MQDNEMKSDHGAQFIAARDSRNRKIPGLQIRNGKYYGHLLDDHRPKMAAKLVIG